MPHWSRRERLIYELNKMARNIVPIYEHFIEMCRSGMSVAQIRAELLKKFRFQVSPFTVKTVKHLLANPELQNASVEEIIEHVKKLEKIEDAEREALEDILEDVAAINHLRDVIRDVRAINYLIAKALPKMENYEAYSPRDILQAIALKSQIIKRAEDTILKRIAFLEEFVVRLFCILNESLPEDIKPYLVERLRKELDRLREGMNDASAKETVE